MILSPLDRETLAALVTECLAEILNDKGVELSEPLGAETRLIGRRSPLDSMDLVALIVEVEQRLAEDFSLPVVLADDAAMSRERSPFLSIGTLVEYVQELGARQS